MQNKKILCLSSKYVTYKFQWRHFGFTSKSLRAGLTDWKSLAKLETRLQVELQMTELLALLEQTDSVTLKVLTSWKTIRFCWC